MERINLWNADKLVSNVTRNTNKINNSGEIQQSFAQYLKNAIEKVNESQIQSDQLTEKLATGQNVDLHNVMIAAEKANITLQTAIEIRNKVIEAYQEIMRMQV
jgi:flagellar hook-basal body complex protein FliE